MSVVDAIFNNAKVTFANANFSKLADDDCHYDLTKNEHHNVHFKENV